MLNHNLRVGVEVHYTRIHELYVSYVSDRIMVGYVLCTVVFGKTQKCVMSTHNAVLRSERVVPFSRLFR